MINEIYGTKLGMTQVWADGERSVPVTVIQAEPNTVCQVKTATTDGYEAVQLGFGAIKENKVNKPMAGHFKKQGTDPVRHLRSARGIRYRLQGWRKGDGGQLRRREEGRRNRYVQGQGLCRRYAPLQLQGGPGGHGAHFHRAPGSIGQCATPSRVFKGLRLPGHMGCDTVTIKNLEVVKVDEEQNLILVKGAVPGGKNATVRIRLA